MGNLIPQLRADVNGKLVTRHVKDGATSSASRREFAAPKLPSGISQKQMDAERPLKKLKKRKVPTTAVDIAALRSPDKKVPDGSIDMSDQEVYEYLKTGLSMGEAVALKSIGVGPYEWAIQPEQGEGEPDGLYATRIARFKNEIKTKDITGRAERFREVGHRLETRGVRADIASKSIENGLSMKALSGYLTEDEVCEIYSKNAYTKNNIKAMDELVNGVIPFDLYKQFGMRNLNNWEKNCPQYRDMPAEIIAVVVEKTKNPYPVIESATLSEAQLMKLAAEDSRVLDLKLPELMLHSFRLPKDGGVFDYEEAKTVDDFIHEVRSRGITDLNERTAYPNKGYSDRYPDSGDRDSTYSPAKILEWSKAGLSTDQIISGMQNRWNKDQAVSVYLEDTAASLADGIL